MKLGGTDLEPRLDFGSSGMPGAAGGSAIDAQKQARRVIARIKKGTRWVLAVVAVGLAVLVGLSAYTNVPTDVTAEDTAVFLEIGLRKPTGPLSFDQQVALIRRVQQEVFLRAPLGDGIPDYESREPADLMRRVRHGLCYDRSRAFDKAFDYLGFESRHVYILFKQDRSFVRALLHHGQASHAVTEVKTSKGWMLVDSNTEWIALTRQGEPVDADAVWQRYSEFDKAPEYLNHPWWAIRGMYSRKGHLYAPYVPFPEFNWPDFFGWVVRGA